MADRNGRRVSIGAFIAGGFLLGAGAFGLLRVTSAQPLAEPGPLPVPSATDSLPAVPLPAPSMPVTPSVPAAAAVPAPVGLSEPAKLPTPSTELPVLPPAASVPLPAPAAPPADAVPAALPTPPALAKSPFDSIPAPAALPAPADGKPVEPMTPTIRPVEPALPAAPAPTTQPDFNLRPESPGLNVNPKEAGVPAPPKPGAEAVPAPKPLVEQTSIPAPPSSAPGDAPMPIPFKQMALSAALGVAMSATAPAADDPAKPMGDAKAPVRSVEDQIKELREDVRLLKEQKGKLELVLNGRDDGKGTTPSEVGVLKRLEKAEADVKDLNKTIKELETKLATQTVAEKKSITAGKGKVVLVNEFRTKLSIMVNGVSYPLDPSQTRDLFLDPGEFSYELVEFPNSSVVKSTIKDGETVTLRIK